MPDTQQLVLSEPAIEAELLLPIPNGTIVRLTDGSVGQVYRSTDEEVMVYHADRWLGGGPWTWPRWQVTEATAEEAWAYAERVTAFRTGMFGQAVR